MAETATQQTDTGATEAQTTAATTATPPEQNGGSEEQPIYSKAQMEAIVRDRLEREKRQSEKTTAKAREEAESAALAKNAEWQALAEKRGEQLAAAEAKAAEVETVQERATRYEAALTSHLDSQRKDLPAHVLSLLDKLDPVDQLEWIAANREVLAKPTNGIPPTPKPTDRNALSDAEQQANRQKFGVDVRGMFV